MYDGNPYVEVVLHSTKDIAHMEFIVVRATVVKCHVVEVEKVSVVFFEKSFFQCDGMTKIVCF